MENRHHQGTILNNDDDRENKIVCVSMFQLTGVNLMWIVFHAIFWDGNAANKEDIIDSLLSPGNMNDKD